MTGIAALLNSLDPLSPNVVPFAAIILAVIRFRATGSE
jgi:hypothetical protein